jgi:diguanylate cyclase (GGDEF)-like protein
MQFLDSSMSTEPGLMTTSLLGVLLAADLDALQSRLALVGAQSFGLDELRLSLIDAADQHRDIQPAAGSMTICADDGPIGRLHWREIQPAPSGDAWGILAEVLRTWILHHRQTQALSAQVVALKRAERIQRALFAMADMASGDLEMPRMLSGIHEILGGLMYAENLAIVRYDPERATMRFMYFVDAEDTVVFDAEAEIPLADLEHSLTLAVIRDGEVARGPSAVLRERLGVPFVDELGPDSADWLGVPMVRSGRVRGAIVVQSYDEAHRFSSEDETVLTYVAQHVLTALERKEARDELEAQVQARTRALHEANRELRAEVGERLRGERLQRALFRIAELSVTAETLERFYQAVHAVVGELLYARNFYIALLSDEASELTFPYSVDEVDSSRPNRKLSKGLTEYVLRQGRPLLADRARILELAQAGEVQSHGPRAICWLGVPLIYDENAVGVLAVQSYSPEVMFSERDLELLTFVGYHIATGLERKRAQDSLQLAYQELEQRVADRTRELAATNRELVDQINERQRIEERLKHQALHDGLTGLPNRSFLLDRLELALIRFRFNRERGFAVLFVDLDRFKVVNDSVGHLVGDELLKEAAARIQSAIRATDTVARLGGDEFAILLEDLHEDAVASRVAQGVIAALADPIRIDGKELFTSASIGIALAHPGYRHAEELLRDADAAMYRAKARGRQRFEVFDEQLRAEALLVLDLEGDLRRGLMRGEFEAYFQPIVRLDNQSVVGYEALLRWNHPKRGLLRPVEFLGVADEIGCLEQIDWLVLEQACDQLVALVGRDTYVGVNVTARQLRRPDFDLQLLRRLAAHGVDGSRLRLEVTEGALLEDPETICATLLRLREAGVLAQLDDFGTGYSSLSYLHRFPIRALKIDRSFIAGLMAPNADSSAAVVRAIIALAGSLRLEVIAEGIETAEQAERVAALGCQLGQGFHYALPLPARELGVR